MIIEGAYKPVMRIMVPTQGNPRWDESIGFRSFHPGGANFLLCDGSVRFIEDNIDMVTYRALASREGGEVVSVQ